MITVPSTSHSPVAQCDTLCRMSNVSVTVVMMMVIIIMYLHNTISTRFKGVSYTNEAYLSKFNTTYKIAHHKLSRNKKS